MKRVLLLLSFMVSISAVFSQQKKINNDLSILKSKTTAWFKNVYVPRNFKDPYSYKLMNCIVSPISLAEKLEENDRDLQYQFEILKIRNKDTTDYFGDYQKSKRDALKAKDDYDRIAKSSDTTGLSRHKKYYDTFLWYYNKQINNFTEVNNLVNKNTEMQKELKNIKSTASPQELKETVEYIVYIDAYGKNSLGNSVLGKYYYKIDKSGKTISEVKMFD